MKKHEAKPAQHRKEMEQLVNRMWQKRSLYRMRGFFDPDNWEQHPIKQTLDEAESITQAAVKAQERATDLKIFEETLAQFRDAGLTHAEETLLKMSHERYFTLPDEQFPEDEVLPYTALILRTDLTLGVIQELKNMKSSEVLVAEDSETNDVADFKRKNAIKRKLCELLPTFKRLLREGPWVNQHEIMVAYCNDVVSRCPPLPALAKFWNLPDKNYLTRYHLITESLSDLNPEIDWQAYGQMIPGFVLFLPGHSSDVLSTLPVEEGFYATAWDFELPKFMTGFKPKAIWFDKPQAHLEYAYATPFASKTEQLGRRAILIPESNGAWSQAELYLTA